MQKKRSIPLLALIAVLVVALSVGNFFAFKYAPIITTYLGQKSYEVRSGNSEEDTEYYKSDFSSEEERLLADAAAARLDGA